MLFVNHGILLGLRSLKMTFTRIHINMYPETVDYAQIICPLMTSFKFLFQQQLKKIWLEAVIYSLI